MEFCHSRDPEFLADPSSVCEQILGCGSLPEWLNSDGNTVLMLSTGELELRWGERKLLWRA